MSFLEAKAMLLLAIAPAVAGLKVHDEDPCACLTWKEAYKAGAVCGFTGREALSVGVAPAMTKHIQDEFCDLFFAQVKDNFCVNWEWGNSTPGKQWCYVSPACNKLGDGAITQEPEYNARANNRTVGPRIAYKSCTEEDQKLILKSPLELQEISVKQNLDIGMLVKQAYPIVGNWSKFTALHMHDQVRQVSHPTVFDSEDGHPPFRVWSAHGGHLYNLYTFNATAGDRDYEGNLMGKMSEFNKMRELHGDFDDHLITTTPPAPTTTMQSLASRTGACGFGFIFAALILSMQ